MKAIAIRVVTVACITAMNMAGGSGSGSINGSIVDTNGAPVPGVLVMVAEVLLAPGPMPPEARYVKSGATGGFLAERLGAGTYRICVDAWARRLLNPCEWGAPTQIQLRESDAKSAGLIRLQAGTAITVLLKDPENVKANVLDDNLNVLARPGIWTAEGRFHWARVASSGGGSHVFEILVPLDTDLWLGFDAENVRISDETDAPVEVSKRFPLRISKGVAPLLYTFRMRSR